MAAQHCKATPLVLITYLELKLMGKFIAPEEGTPLTSPRPHMVLSAGVVDFLLTFL